MNIPALNRLLYAALFSLVVGLLSSCSAFKTAAMKVNTPEVQAKILGDVEQTVLAGGGALILSHGNWGAAVAAMTQEELKHFPKLQQKLAEAAAANASASSGLSGGAGSALLPPIVGPLPSGK